MRKIELKSIKNLIDDGINFFIPSYQRGYRWEKKEVKDLLDDINKFKGEDDKYYCLQPVIVKRKNDNEYEVIDGQQRLTTIYLILQYFSKFEQKNFQLSYETKNLSSDFLENLQKENPQSEGFIVEDNIDNYYISSAYKSIQEWFDEKRIDEFKYYSKLTSSTKVIWFESKDDAIQIFTRINAGKIALTSAELIKALFLNQSNLLNSIKDKQEDIPEEKLLRDAYLKVDKKQKLKLKQLEISSEWDEIEQELQNDNFWYFLNNQGNIKNHIEIIFNLINKKFDEKNIYSSFNFFNEKDSINIEAEWDEVKKYFERFKEWYNDRELYHKIGYLLVDKKIDYTLIGELVAQVADQTKKKFKEYLNNKIKQEFKDISLEELEYGDDTKKIKKLLLLYNIQTVLNNDNMSKFPFCNYKKEKWDIEHIISIAEHPPGKKEYEQWLKDAIKFIEEEDLKKEAENFNTENSKFDNEKFEVLFEKITSHFNQHFKEENQNNNGISNLTLLDSSTNRGYKNAVFPVKRMTIIKKEKNGTFIPICTKHLFLKYFSDYPPKISFWTPEDRKNYFKDLQSILNNFINNE